MSTNTLNRLKADWDRRIWNTDLRERPSWQRRLVHTVRLVFALGRDFSSGQLSLHAMSLVYTTLLSIVPLLAVSFSVLKGFGVHNQIQPMLMQLLTPLGTESAEIAQQLIRYVDNTNVGVLGSIGLAFLLYSVLSLVSKIELVLNETWRVTQPRPWGQRISQYLSLLLIGPVLFFSAIGATASARSTAIVQWLVQVQPFGLLLDAGAQLVPYLLIVIAFTFVYTFIPNTRVQLRAAILGALVAGVLWQSVGYLFSNTMAGSTRYTAIYSGLAILILFMIWVYIAWLILLIGANIAFYTQFPEFLAIRARNLRLSNRLREQVALSIATEIAARHAIGQAPVTAEQLSKQLGLPKTNIQNLLDMLCRAHFLLPTADDPARYVPARAPANIRLTDLLLSLRSSQQEGSNTPTPTCQAAVMALQARLEAAIETTLGAKTLADLADDVAPSSTEAGVLPDSPAAEDTDVATLGEPPRD